MSQKPWLVQKYGGTSVGKFPLQIAKDVVAKYEQDYRVVVVCSARSSNVKSQGTTTCLIRAADNALAPDGNSKDIIEEIRQDHLRAAREVIEDPVRLAELQQEISTKCMEANRVLDACEILCEVSTRTFDLVLSIGELLSCIFLAAVIRSTGRDATVVDLSHIFTDKQASDLNGEFYGTLSVKIAEAIKSVGDAVPVVTGFFGLVPGGLINSVGRGYTDLCAALAAVGLRANELQVWKEVDGIYTADPRKVPTARLLSQITPEEAAELTYYGSEVIHPFTMDQVIRARIPIRIKNVMNPTGNGTVVFPTNDSLPGVETPVHPPIAVTPSRLNLALRNGPTAVTSKSNILVLNVHSNKTRQSHGFFARVFTTLDKWRLVVDLISTSEVHVSMAIHAGVPQASLTDALQELRQIGTVDVTRKLCIVSLVGTHMKQFVGLASKMFTTLAEAGINIEMISQGASEINISCVIAEKDGLKALNVLHHKLLNSQAEV